MIIKKLLLEGDHSFYPFIRARKKKILDFHYSKRKPLYKSYYIFTIFSKTRIYFAGQEHILITTHNAQICCNHGTPVALSFKKPTV